MMANPATNLRLTSTDNMSYFIKVLDRKGIAWKSIAQQLDLPTDLYSYEQWIPLERFALFVDKLTPMAGETFGLEVGRAAHQALIEQHLDTLFEKAPNIESLAIEVMNRSHQISRHVVYWLERKNDKWLLCNRGKIRPNYPGYAQIEWYRISLLIEVVKKVLGKNWQPHTIYMMTSPHLGAYSSSFYPGTKVEFEHIYSAIELPIDSAFVPYPDLVRRVDPIHEITLLTETYAHLPNFGSEWVASLMGVSRRTLQRYLNKMNLNFSELKERAKENTAKQLLANPNLSVEEVAFRLGYSDLANFSRAFHKRVGIRPAKYRDSLTR